MSEIDMTKVSNVSAIEILERKVQQYKNEIEEARDIIENQHKMYYNLIVSTHYDQNKRVEETARILTYEERQSAAEMQLLKINETKPGQIVRKSISAVDIRKIE
jgi:hypothetical protein